MKNPTYMNYVYGTAESNTVASEIPSRWCLTGSL